MESKVLLSGIKASISVRDFQIAKEKQQNSNLRINDMLGSFGKHPIADNESEVSNQPKL